MNVNQDYLTQITELEATNQALKKEIRALKHAQATLKETENKFRTMVEHAAEGIVVTQDLQKVYYNPAWLKLIGYSAEEYEPLPLLSLIHPDDLELAKETYFQLTRKAYEYRIIVKSGDTKWIATRASTIEWDGKPAELFITEDITERKKMEQALQASEQNLLEAQAMAHVGHWEWDIPNDKIQWSDEVYRIYGLDPGAELNYDTLMSLIHPDDRDYHNETTAAWLKNRGGDPYEYRIIRPDGSIRYIYGTGKVECDKAGEPNRFIGTVQDITTLKLTETNLRASEARFRATFEQAAVGIAHVALDGTFLRLNQKYCEIVGYDLDEMLKLTFQDITHPDDLETDLAYVRKLLAGQITTYSMEKRYIKKNGDIVWVNLTVSLIGTITTEPDYFVAVIDDITERKQTDEELRLHSGLINAVGEAVIATDMQGEIIFWNQAAERIYGWERDEVLGKDVVEVTPAEESSASAAEIVESLKQGKFWSGEFWVRHKDGHKFSAHVTDTILEDEYGNPKAIIGVSEDITERKRAEEELQASEQRFAALFEHAAIGIDLVDTAGHLIVHNPAVERFLGYSSEELRGRTFHEFAHPEDIDIDVALFNELIANLRDNYQIEKQFITKDGRTVWGRLTVSVVRKKGGEPRFLIRMIEDITRRKRIEQALNESELKYRTVVEMATEGIMVVQDYERKYYNSAFREMTGYSEEDYESNPFMTIIHPEDVSAIEKVYQALVSQQAEDAYSEFRIYTKSGDIKWLSIHGTSIEWEGRPAGMVIANDITERKHWEEQIQAYQRQLKALASQLTLTEEQERRRIAAELHDQVGQSLAFSRMQIAAARNAKSDDQRMALLDQTSETLKETIQDTRSLVFDLSSPLLNELGLNAAISEWMEEHLEKQAGLKAELIEIGSKQHLSADMRAIVFRSVRELLNNVIRHARATCVRITVEQTSTQTCITVHDDGIGFQPEDIGSELNRAGGFGLFSIQERMSNLGGSFTVQSAPGEGTKIALCIPNQVS